MDVLELPGRMFRLGRPGAESRNLRAWDAADEQLIDKAETLYRTGQNVLILDDQFGALALGLAHMRPIGVSDSAVTPLSVANNARENGCEAGAVQSWLNPPTGTYDLVVMRIPRHLAYLEFLLRWVNGVMNEKGALVAGGMIKHLPGRSAELFGRLIVTDEVCPARKKARIIVGRKGAPLLEGWDGAWQGYCVPDSDMKIASLPAVFSRDRLDIGTRLLIPQVRRHATSLPSGARVLDLACGNGVLGLVALQSNADLALTFADVSSQAVASVKRSATAAFPGRAIDLWHADGISTNAGLFDLILLNPPFHEGGVVGDHIALRLFRHASQHLKPGGQLLMVGNRHLGYHRSLLRTFQQIEQLSADPKFVVFAARHH
ncbi:class I SAM-dependent methyltransferase [Marinobacter caseinilyticus]|uniref:class I SAM-dependent methyltransferase n=1 Tax=Marinobacter caseinilyticus TaxID=2692195 RepID=UPI001409A728|nr:class I SAM-dependent methyltransferase [Marinobacter caseinilyticus]